MIRKNIQQGGITQLDVDAIVSADNEHLDGSKIAKELKAEGKWEHTKLIRIRILKIQMHIKLFLSWKTPQEQSRTPSPKNNSIQLYYIYF